MIAVRQARLMESTWDCVIVGGGAAGLSAPRWCSVSDFPMEHCWRARAARATTLHQRSTLAAQLGVDAAEPTPVAEDPGAVDGFYRTAAPGVFAAGDLSQQMPQVAAAVASGSLAAAAVVQSLLADDHGFAVAEGRRHVYT